MPLRAPSDRRYISQFTSSKRCGPSWRRRG
ncbi:hypothetical protein [Nocardia pneumoniae]